jgi:hypothetical protein
MVDGTVISSSDRSTIKMTWDNTSQTWTLMLDDGAGGLMTGDLWQEPDGAGGFNLKVKA